MYHVGFPCECSSLKPKFTLMVCSEALWSPKLSCHNLSAQSKFSFFVFSYFKSMCNYLAWRSVISLHRKLPSKCLLVSWSHPGFGTADPKGVPREYLEIFESFRLRPSQTSAKSPWELESPEAQLQSQFFKCCCFSRNQWDTEEKF